ncbi:ABC transporter ATP-binding protein [Candidatus Woesearchaeota archaeon]|nr:ABC transporter ATP-binding protein [Candidatus Woesearchaeota archaeon]
MSKKTSKPIIELRNVWKIYQMGDGGVKVNALRGLDLAVKKGEFLSIMGPSGSGKSTAMNMIGALDIPTKGKILLEGQDIALLTESDLAQIRGRKIGFIFQQFNLIPTLSAVENIMLPMIFQNIPRHERVERASNLLRMVDLGDRIYHRPTELSGGEQQRVAIARALSNNPDVVLADEPTGNLDSKTGETVMDFLKKLHKKEGKTIIMVTHDVNIARRADRTEYLLDGRIIKTKKNIIKKRGR